MNKDSDKQLSEKQKDELIKFLIEENRAKTRLIDFVISNQKEKNPNPTSEESKQVSDK